MASLRALHFLYLVDVGNSVHGVSYFVFSHPGKCVGVFHLRRAAGMYTTSWQQRLFLRATSGSHARMVRDLVARCVHDAVLRALFAMYLVDTRCGGMLAELGGARG